MEPHNQHDERTYYERHLIDDDEHVNHVNVLVSCCVDIYNARHHNKLVTVEHVRAVHDAAAVILNDNDGPGAHYDRRRDDFLRAIRDDVIRTNRNYNAPDVYDTARRWYDAERSTAAARHPVTVDG